MLVFLYDLLHSIADSGSIYITTNDPISVLLITEWYSIVYMYYISEYILVYFLLGFPGGSVVKNLPAIAGDPWDLGSIPGSRRLSGEGNGPQVLFYFLGCVLSCLVMYNCCNPTDCSPPGSSVHGISQARILKWVAISYSRRSSQPRDWTHVSCIARWIFYCRANREAPFTWTRFPKK